MASKRQLQRAVWKAEDDLRFQKAKTNSLARILVRRLSTESNPFVAKNQAAFWIGYWEGREDKETTA